MARAPSSFACNNCGAVTNKWSGKCESCEQWNTISEEAGSTAPPIGRGAKATKGQAITLTSLAGSDAEPERKKTGISEFDRTWRCLLHDQRRIFITWYSTCNSCFNNGGLCSAWL